MVTINEIILVLGVFIPLFLVGIWQLNRVNPSKKGAKAADSSIKELFTVHNSQVTEVLKLKDKAISSLQAKIRYYEQEEEEEPEEKGLQFDELKALAVQYGVKPAIFDMPFVKNYIKKNLKGMSIEEILALGKQFGFIKGDIQLKKGDPNATTTPQNPDYF